VISSCLSWSHSSRLGEGGGGGGDGDRERERELPRRSVSLQYEMARATDSALSRAVSSTAAAIGDGDPLPSSLLAFLSLLEILRRYLPTTSPLILGAMVAAACGCCFTGARAREPRSSLLPAAAAPLPPAPKHSGVVEGLSCRDRDLKNPRWPSLDDVEDGDEREEPDPAALTLDDGDHDARSSSSEESAVAISTAKHLAPGNSHAAKNWISCMAAGRRMLPIEHDGLLGSRLLAAARHLLYIHAAIDHGGVPSEMPPCLPKKQASGDLQLEGSFESFQIHGSSCLLLLLSSISAWLNYSLTVGSLLGSTGS
jgi:hypothetical protein